jgi:hypothetical protein
VAGPLVVVGDVGTALSLAPADLKSLPRTRVRKKDDDRTLIYEASSLPRFSNGPGATWLGSPRVMPSRQCVVASASDGYQVVFSIGELDPGLTSNEIIVADAIDGKPLLAHRVRFGSVMPHRCASDTRSIRMLTRLEVIKSQKPTVSHTIESD